MSFASDPPMAQPGFNYSTQGVRAGRLRDRRSLGGKYANSVRKSVRVAAGLMRTRPDDRLAMMPLRTRFYSRDKSDALVNAEFLDASYKVAGGAGFRQRRIWRGLRWRSSRIACGGLIWDPFTDQPLTGAVSASFLTR